MISLILFVPRLYLTLACLAIIIVATPILVVLDPVEL